MPKKKEVLHTDMETENKLTGKLDDIPTDDEAIASPQIETLSDESLAKKKNRANESGEKGLEAPVETVVQDADQNESDVGAPAGEKSTPSKEEKPKRRRVPGSTEAVMSIDGRRKAQPEEDKAKVDLLDLYESMKAGRILTATIQGVEMTEMDAVAVLYHGAYKILIPFSEFLPPPEDYRGKSPRDAHHYLIHKRLGAEIDYIVKGIDSEACVAVASRIDAMRAKRKHYYFGTDRNGYNFLYQGLIAEARVVASIRNGVFVDIFGLEVFINIRELSYQRLMDAEMYFQPGQRVYVRIISIDKSDRDNIKISASIRQATENPYEKAIRRLNIGNMYVGTVSMVDTHGVFVALDGGVDCLCPYPKRGRPPRGSRVTVRITALDKEANRIWGTITHFSAPR